MESWKYTTSIRNCILKLVHEMNNFESIKKNSETKSSKILRKSTIIFVNKIIGVKVTFENPWEQCQFQFRSRQLLLQTKENSLMHSLINRIHLIRDIYYLVRSITLLKSISLDARDFKGRGWESGNFWRFWRLWN